MTEFTNTTRPETTPLEYTSVFFAPTDMSRAAGQQAAGRIFGARTRRADDVADPPSTVRRRLRLRDPEPLDARASLRDRASDACP